jgi:hypothetical protein
MAATATLAHAAGVPVEEVLPLVLAAGATASVGVRVAWARLRSRVRARTPSR